MYSDPMPGENYENAAEREKALAEKEAIANGENFNPNLSAEAAEGFANLESEVPFAGDNPQAETEQTGVGEAAELALTAAEIATEGPAVAATEALVSTGLDVVGEAMQSEDESGQTPSELAADVEKQAHSSSNPIEREFNERWDNEQTPNLDDIQESVERDYMSGAIEQSTTSASAQAEIANADRESTDVQNPGEANSADNPHDISEAAAMQAVSAAALAEDLTDKIKAGDEQAISKISEVEERAANASSLAEKINTANANNAENNVEAQMATNVAVQAQEKAAEAIQTVTEAQNEYDAMSEEEKAETQAAAEAAEQNGTTIEEEKAKAEAEKDDSAEEDNYTPDLSRGIFG